MKEYSIQEEKRIESKKTPNYDILYTRYRKVLAGTAAIAIPEFCEALRKDWYSDKSEKDIEDDIEAQHRIKSKIMKDWCNTMSDDGLGWSDGTIDQYWPEWLTEPYTEGQNIMGWQSYRNFMKRVQASKTKFNQLIESLPNVPKAAEPEPLGPHVESLKTPEELYSIAMNACGRLWTSLANYKGAPPTNKDIKVDLLIPSKDFALRLIMGLDSSQKAMLYKQLSMVEVLIGDRLKVFRDVLRDEKKPTR